MSVAFQGWRPPSLRHLALGLALVVATAAQADTGTAPEPRKPIDPNHFLGRWYEIARIPNKLQADCQGATSDWATASGGQYTVVQTCHSGSPAGPAKVWKGAGHMIAPAKIRIGFFAGLIQKDYWVVDRSDDYSWSIMSMPDRKYVWIMSRRPVLSAPQKAALVARAQSLGYDTARLVYDEQAPAA